VSFGWRNRVFGIDTRTSLGAARTYAGGGVKRGTVYGATDERGYRAVVNPVSVADFHATILHLMGLDYKQLFYEIDGKREKLTGNFEARIVSEILV